MGTINFKVAAILLVFSFGVETTSRQEMDSEFISFTTEPLRIKMYWKDDRGEILGSIQNLKQYVETKKQKLRFAMNGGMYLKDNSPQGLFVENGKTIKQLDTFSGKGNFYLKPNGVFYLTTDNRAVICRTEDFKGGGTVTFATQSGPMLLIEGHVHPAFIKGSTSLYVRNGVGILPDGRILFAMSKREINFYDFAEFFKKSGCKNALYLDGFVSRTYLPEENWEQLDGNFGVIIGVIR